MKKLLIVLAVVVGLGFYVNAFAELQVVDGPITAQSVTVNGQITIKGGSPGAGKVLTSDATGLATWQTSAASGIGGSGTTNYFPIFTGTSTIGNSVVYQTGSNVGVGTTSPSYKLDVTGGGRFTDNLVLTRSMDQLKFEVPSALRYWFMSKPSVNYAFGWYSPDEIGWLMYLKTGTGDLILPGSNKLGIGTADPLGKLQLGGSNYENDLLLLGAFNTTYVKSGRLGAIYPYVIDSRLVADASGWGLGWTHENVSTGDKYTMMYLSPDGQFGSNYRLWLDGPISLGNISKSYADIGSGMPTMSANIKFDPASNSYINSGNVGIGNASPSYKLDVSGSMRVTGTIYSGGTANGNIVCRADGTNCPGGPKIPGYSCPVRPSGFRAKYTGCTLYSNTDSFTETKVTVSGVDYYIDPGSASVNRYCVDLGYSGTWSVDCTTVGTGTCAKWSGTQWGTASSGASWRCDKINCY